MRKWMDISRENLFVDIVAYMINRCMHSRNQSCVTNGTVLVWRGKVALKLLTQVKCFLNDVRGIFCWILKQNYPLKKKNTFVNYHQPRSKIHLCSVFTKRIMPGEITRLGRGMFKNCVKRWVNILEAQPHIISHKREKLTWHMNGIQFYFSIFTFQIITRERSIGL